jgi:glycerophosphoryl diester phosphodiesterase
MVEIIAHRGARSIAPENTLAAARRAWELGAHRWETDVTLTRDRQLVLFHDLSLSRCTDAPDRFGYPAPGKQNDSDSLLPREVDRLSHYTLAELITLDLGSVFLSEDPFSAIAQGKISQQALSAFKGERIPTLAQGLELTRDLDFQINIELKDHKNEPEPFFLAGQTLAVIEQTGISLDKVTISSFNHDWLDWVSPRAPKIEIQALVGDNDDLPLDFKDFAFSTYNVNAKLITETQVKELKAL